MTAWDFLNGAITGFPFAVTALFLIAALVAVIIFMVGFSRHGIDFVKHGFKQKNITELGEKIDGLAVRMKTEGEKIDGIAVRMKTEGEKIDGIAVRMKTELDTIKVNHFGHLKNYLGLLNGALLDKGIVNNEMKARLDNELRGM